MLYHQHTASTILNNEPKTSQHEPPISHVGLGLGQLEHVHDCLDDPTNTFSCQEDINSLYPSRRRWSIREERANIG
jgi:hypothetical protein